MATIKSFTDLQQSKKLAEFLPLESADMRYGHIAPYEFSDRMYDGGYDKVPYPKDFLKLCADFCEEDIYDGSLLCWSLAALLDNLDYPQLSKDKLGSGKTGWMVSVYPDDCRYDSCWHDNPVDACYEMIIKLHEQNLL